ncbi:14 kDa zinc-binding [Gossypium arboreum]|uniref:14 kDa zinc-binding n=1 Tax=Gossypium arboreum TaxID=29729 RepID=A0A0B0NKG2_GOSAR|nr:14 kDa zinc-binding [Gossypium arboreum]
MPEKVERFDKIINKEIPATVVYEDDKKCKHPMPL